MTPILPFYKRLAVALIGSSIVLAVVRGDSHAEDAQRSADQWLKYFSENWDEKDWNKPSAAFGYLRPLDDQGWQARMLALRGLVASGDSAVAPLAGAAKDGDVATRILALQALGYLAPHAPRDVLLAAAQNDASAAARLYAVDSLGMQGGTDPSDSLAPLLKSERNRDVRMHVGYVNERKDKGLDPRVVKSLVEWDPKTMNSAIVGEPAPDFELETISGQKIRLSDFRGKKSVVLVFIYGDT